MKKLSSKNEVASVFIPSMYGNRDVDDVQDEGYVGRLSSRE